MIRIDTPKLSLRAGFGIRVLWLIGFVCHLGANTGNQAYAHDSLYNYVELRVLESSALEVTFSVHAAEFAESPKVDPTSTDTSWYTALSAKERDALQLRANQFLAEAYSVRRGEASSQESISLPEVVATESLETGPRPGCLIGVLLFERCPRSLSFDYHETGKRLMLVVNRPGNFPKVHDLASGSTHTIQFTVP